MPAIRNDNNNDSVRGGRSTSRARGVRRRRSNFGRHARDTRQRRDRIANLTQEQRNEIRERDREEIE